jgi:hypothetical protein
MKADENDKGYPIKYLYGGTQQLRPDQIVNVQNAHPDSFWKGQSPTKAALHDIETDATARKRTRYNMENRIGADLIFRVKGYFGVAEEQRKAIKKVIDENYTGATKEGTPMIVGDRVEIDKFPDRHLSKEIFDARNYSRAGILAVFRTPPPIVGVYDNATLQNFATALKIWWQIALFPLLDSWYSSINQQAIWPIYDENVRLWYDITGSQIGLLLFRELIAGAQDLVNLGYPPNLAAARVGLNMPHVPELDVPNVNLTLAGRPDPNQGAEEGPESAADQKLTAFSPMRR